MDCHDHEADGAEPGHLAREAKPEDLGAIMALLRPCMQSQQLLDRTDSEVARLLQHGFVADVEGTIVGFAAVEVYSKKMAEIQCLVVDSQCRNRGIGKQLITSCVVRAGELGISEVMAITLSESLFASCGFTFSLPGQKKALFITP